MNHAIYYFTGSGNSLALARNLSQKTGYDTVIPIAGAIGERLPAKLDSLGIVCPNYAYYVPHIVRKFIKKITAETEVGYLYLILSAGGNHGNAVDKVKKLIKRFPNKAVFTVLMPYNYPAIGDVFSPEKEKSRLDKAEPRMAEIAKKIKLRASHFDPKVDYYKVILFPGLFYALAYPTIPNMDKNFRVTSSCNGCGICEKVCPVQNITIEEKKPVWHHRCEQCFACYNWCPKQSLHSGKSTEGKGRYRHPEVTLKEMFLF